MNYDDDLACRHAAFDARRAVATLESHGCYVVRDALPRGPLEDLLAGALAEYDRMQERFQAGQLSETEIRRNHGYGILRPFEDDLTSAAGMPIDQAMLGFVRDSVMADIVEGYLGDDVSLLIEACHIRRQGPGQPGRPVPLHQDCSVMRMKHGRLLNFWVPLVDGAGRSSPGLEFYPVTLDRVLDCPRRPPAAGPGERMYSRFEITDADVRAATGNVPAWRPVLNRGDVLCLDGWTVHRTNFDPAMTDMRYGFEIRFCRNADLQPTMPGRIDPFSPKRRPA